MIAAFPCQSPLSETKRMGCHFMCRQYFVPVIVATTNAR
jgi:hypothetical protein